MAGIRRNAQSKTQLRVYQIHPAEAFDVFFPMQQLHAHMCWYFGTADLTCDIVKEWFWEDNGSVILYIVYPRSSQFMIENCVIKVKVRTYTTSLKEMIVDYNEFIPTSLLDEIVHTWHILRGYQRRLRRGDYRLKKLIRHTEKQLYNVRIDMDRVGRFIYRHMTTPCPQDAVPEEVLPPTSENSPK